MKQSTYDNLWLFHEKLQSLQRSADETSRWAKKAAEALKQELREAEREEKRT